MHFQRKVVVGTYLEPSLGFGIGEPLEVGDLLTERDGVMYNLCLCEGTKEAVFRQLAREAEREREMKAHFN